MKKRTHSCVDGFVHFREGSEAYNYGTKSKKTRSLGLILSCMSKRTVFVPSQKQWRTFNEYSALYSHKFSFIPLPKAFFFVAKLLSAADARATPQWPTVEHGAGPRPHASGDGAPPRCGLRCCPWSMTACPGVQGGFASYLSQGFSLENRRVSDFCIRTPMASCSWSHQKKYSNNYHSGQE